MANLGTQSQQGQIYNASIDATGLIIKSSNKTETAEAIRHYYSSKSYAPEADLFLDFLLLRPGPLCDGSTLLSMRSIICFLSSQSAKSILSSRPSDLSFGTLQEAN